MRLRAIRLSAIVAASLVVALVPSPAFAATIQRAPRSTWQTVGSLVDGKNLNGRVDAIAYGKGSSAGMVFLAGRFTQVKPPGTGGTAVTRNRVAAFNVSTGALVSTFNPNVQSGNDPEVFALALSPDGSKLFIGGRFASVGGVARRHLAVVSATTGKVVDLGSSSTWSPNPDAPVKTIQVDPGSNRLFIGGQFVKVNGQGRVRLAAFDLASGALVSTFHPSVTQVSTIQCPPRCAPQVNGLAVSGGKLYMGGSFAYVNGKPRNNAAAVNVWNGGLNASFKPNVFQSGMKASLNIVYEVEALGSRIYLCGDFWAVNGAATPNLAAVDGSSGALLSNFHSTTDGAVNDCSVSGSGGLNVLVFVGHFDYAGGPNAYNSSTNRQIRHHVAAADPTTGALDAWNPTLNSKVGGYAVAQLGTSKIVVGGDFTTVNGKTQSGFAQFSASA
jgi:hypothetical protein